MNTQQLKEVLTKDRYVGRIFNGVFARDQLPKFQNGAYVINTDPADFGKSTTY